MVLHGDSPTLSEVLASIPAQTMYRMPSEDYSLEHVVCRVLYYACAKHGVYYESLFPDVDVAEHVAIFPKTYTEALRRDPHKPFYALQKPRPNFSHKGRTCAYKIPPGEPVYNCYDCGVDPTCCMCDHCFNKEEHSDHNVAMHYSTGNAICDCGDQFSWKTPLQCRAALQDAEHDADGDLPPEFKRAIQDTITTVMDFFLDVQQLNVQTVPAVHKFFEGCQTAQPFRKFAMEMRLPEEKYGAASADEDLPYWLLVWNDEFHDRPRAISSLKAACHAFSTSSSNCNHQTSVVDKFGFAALFSSDHVSELIPAFLEVQADGLTATIARTDALLLNYISVYCIKWVSKILESANSKVAEFAKRSLSWCLLQKYFVPLCETSVVPKSQLKDEMGLLVVGKIPGTVRGDLDFSQQTLSVSKLLSTEPDGWFKHGPLKDEENTVAPTRIQLLFFMEMRYPKSTRQLIKESLLSVVTNTFEARVEFARQIADIICQLEYLNQYEDREWNLSLMETFRLQVYHDPSIGTKLLEEGRLRNILKSALVVLINPALTRDLSEYRYKSNIEELATPSWQKSRATLTEMDVLMGIQSITSYIEPGFSPFFEIENFCYVAALMALFQKCFKIVRKVGEHVLREDTKFNSYYKIVTVAYSITQNVGRLVAGFEDNDVNVERCIRFLSSYAAGNVQEDLAWSTPTVSRNHISFIRPLHGLLEQMCFYYPSFFLQLLTRKVKRVDIAEGNLIAADENDNKVPLGFIACDILDSFVLSAQIRTGFWIRNGTSVLAQEYTYREYFGTDYDLFFLQLTVMTGDVSLRDILRRWEVAPCVDGEITFENSIYEDRTSPILLELCTMFYHLLTYSTPFDYEVDRDDFLRLTTHADLAYCLCQKRRKYSELSDMFGTDLDFEGVLKEVANFIPPRGVKDYGQYALKDEIYTALDPMDMMNKYEPADGIHEAIAANVAAHRKTTPDQIVVKPQLRKLIGQTKEIMADITRLETSPLFAKYLYKTLQFAIDSEMDDHLMATLHIIHAIILDDTQRYSEDDTHLQSLIDIPICNLLMYIAEMDSVSKSTAKKAAAVLDALLLKDDGVLQSLVDCYGQHHVERYRNSKQGRGLRSKKERAHHLAMKRQKKILAKMRGQQKEFMDKNKTVLEDKEEEKTDDKKESEERLCIICRNPENCDELFGIPAFILPSAVFSTACVIPRCSELGEPIVKNVITGCPHGMHFSCFVQMVKEKKYTVTGFCCPLCRNFCNTFLPSFSFAEVQLDAADELQAHSIAELRTETQGDNCSALTSQVFNNRLFHVLCNAHSAGYKKITTQLLQLVKRGFNMVHLDSDSEASTVDQATAIPLLIGSTLQMTEISQRGDQSVETPISPVNKLIIRSLVQYRILLNYVSLTQEDQQKMETSSLEVLSTLEESFLEAVLTMFLAGNESFATLIRYHLARLIVQMAASTMLAKVTEDVHPLDEGSATFHALRRFCYRVMVQSPDTLPPETYSPQLVQTIYNSLSPFFVRYTAQVRLLADCFDFSADSILDRLSLDSIFVATQKHHTFESKVFEDELANGLVSKCSEVRRWDFPGEIHFTALPDKLSQLLSYRDTAGHTFDKSKHDRTSGLCLRCGQIVEYEQPGRMRIHASVNGAFIEDKMAAHMEVCGMGSGVSYGFFFSPFNNTMQIYVTGKGLLGHGLGGRRHSLVSFMSPYMNRHGEPAGGLFGSGDSGSLDKNRWQYINRIYLNQELVVTGYREWAAQNGRRGMTVFNFDMLRGMAEEGMIPDIDNLIGRFVTPEGIPETDVEMEDMDDELDNDEFF